MKDKAWSRKARLDSLSLFSAFYILYKSPAAPSAVETLDLISGEKVKKNMEGGSEGGKHTKNEDRGLLLVEYNKI